MDALQFTVEAASDRKAVARVGTLIVGSASAYVDSKRDLVILESWVLPEYRRRGIATALYRTIEKVSGRTLKPDASLSAEALAFWRAYRPAALTQ
ncbi:GNAT family N-acetyltransferase [Paucibacter soli]|uniref:GNAT family N-acetyltransferase n=1 Tax=Paucibacter soli TaxID=3133433 RepID=UPI0030974C04